MPRPLAPTRFESRARLVLLALLLAGCTPHRPAGERLYVSDERGDQVVAIDPVSGGVVEQIAAGRRPRGLAVSPDGATLYVAVSGSPIGGPDVDEDDLPPPDHKADGIAVVDLASGKVARMLNVGHDPETFALSGDGRMLYVSNEDDGAISQVATDGGRTPITTKVGDEPEGVALSSDGKSLFVACEGSDHVAMLDARTMKLIRTIRLSGRPRGALASHDGSSIFISIEGAGKLAILDADRGRLRTLLDLAQGDKDVRPMGIIEAPDGHLFVTTGRAGTVIEVDPKAGTILRTIANVGARPWGIGLTADGATLVTANGPSGDVSLISRTSGKVIRKLNVGKGPWAVAGRAGSGAQ
jgi:YVTN family beta-propeller protein